MPGRYRRANPATLRLEQAIARKLPKPKPTPGASAVSLPEPQAAPPVDLTGISPPDPARARNGRRAGAVIHLANAVGSGNYFTAASGRFRGPR